MKNVEDAYPLSPTQQGMLFENLYAAKGNGLYVEQITWEMHGDLDTASYRRAWEIVVRRHPALRTALLWESLERPLQVVRQQVEVPWEELDWRGEPLQAQHSKFATLLESERSRGFDLSRAPLLRFHLVHIADDAFRFLWTFHHVILDGWSEPLVLREVLTAYEKYSRQDAPVAPTSRSYRDYIAWLGHQDHIAAEAFWRKRLEGFSRPTSLPLETPGQDEDDSFGELERTWTSDASHGLQQFLRAEKVTLSTLVQGAWAFVLSTYCGQRDIVFGNVVAGRSPSLPNADSVIGLLANTLPVRVTIDPAQKVGEWLRALQTSESLTRAHEHVALVDVIGWSEVPRGTPLFESLLAVENLQSSMPAMLDGQLEICAIKRLSSRASYPLVLGVVPGRILSLSIGFKRNRFNIESIERLMAQFQFALETFVTCGDSLVEELPLLAAGDRQTIVVDWNSTAVPFPTDRGVYVIFDERARKTPNAIAVIDGEMETSYAQLEARSNRIARWLRRQGAGHGDTIGLLMHRWTGLLAAILGILKAGAAYVPLDVASPAERHALIIADAKVCLVLSDRIYSDEACKSTKRVVTLDNFQAAIDAEDDGPLEIESHPEDIAYVVYTSGSTGRPKGVAVSHRALLNHCQAIAHHYQLNDRDRVLQFASIAFDLAAEEIFPAWASGAAVVLSSPGRPGDIAGFLRFVQRNRLTVLNLPAVYWQEWVREIERSYIAVPSSVRLVVTGNERVSIASLRAWRKNVKDVRWLNAYGPTEATITSTLYEPEAELTSLHGETVPIGRPIANVQAYVLDLELRPVPVGAAGELFLGGSGVAAGYLNDVELTAARFISDPFDMRPGTRLYRTGDRARWRTDGNLEFLGRTDEQIKIHGFRIEPGEIESALRVCAGVEDAVVVTRADTANGGLQLVAYIVARDRSPIELWPSVGEYPIYDELLYFAMTSDEPRNRAYRAAIERTVPGRTVVEIGTGADAILARFCVEAGAKRVYAIEKSEQAFQAARRRIADMGLTERVIVLHGDSAEVELPELVDVCVSEIIGTIGSSEGAAAILNDARRFLKPGGVMVPDRCVTHIAAVSLPEDSWAGAGFSPTSADYLERVFQSIGHRFDVRMCLKHFEGNALISDSATFEDLNFAGLVSIAFDADIT
ncbi:MAG TPA: amino acid adenylation domain-containing protein, partial [Lacipirellulaceae bacterium]|nr:amino acid adenylation domain-containing protein [Lacipirellulaceae bacterium]